MPIRIGLKALVSHFWCATRTRSFQLAGFLQGQALDVYQRMTDDNVENYEVLKNSLLKRFILTEGSGK